MSSTASPLSESTKDSTELLVIYLQDHDAAAQAGHALARRCEDSNADTDLGRYLREQFLPELDEEKTVLVDLLASVDASPSQVKRAALRAGEVAGRLKGNGRLLSYSPLSRVIELEALIAGVHAKQRLWVAVGVARGDHPTLPDVSRHEEMAAIQLEHLQRHHARAVEIAFTTGATRA